MTPEIPSRPDVIRAHRDAGGRIAAVFPIHQPRALFRAFGLLPVEVWGPPGVETGQGDAHLQAYACSIVRSGLSFVLDGGLDVADVLVVPHACDSLQGLGSVLLDFARPEKERAAASGEAAERPVLTLYLPRGGRESDTAYFAEELRVLGKRLAEITGKTVSDADLLAAVEREEAADAALARIHRERARLPYDDAALYRLIRSREYLPAERFLDLAESALAAAPGDAGQGRAPARKGVPVVLSGIVPEPMAVFDAIRDAGGVVAADDFASCGRRLYPAGRSRDPYRRMAERIQGGPPDPTRGSPIRARVDYLRGLAEETGARGVVFYTVKFCEPELFDLPLLRKGLEEAGLPSVTMEIDINDPLSHQVVTRLEAFLEML